jgi:hypothetical protein
MIPPSSNADAETNSTGEHLDAGGRNETGDGNRIPPPSCLQPGIPD